MPRRKKNKLSPENVLKETVYFGSGEKAAEIAAMLNEDMERLNSDLSPLIVHAYSVWHNISPIVEEIAKAEGVGAADVINRAVREYRDRHTQAA